MKEAKDHWHTNVINYLKKNNLFLFTKKIFLSANSQDKFYQLLSVAVHSFYRKATVSTSTSTTEMLYRAVPQSNWLKKPPWQSPAISRFPACVRLICLFYGSSPPFQRWCMKAEQKAVLPGCFSQPDGTELLGQSCKSGPGSSLSVLRSWQMGLPKLKPSFNPKAVGYYFTKRKLFYEKASEVTLKRGSLLIFKFCIWSWAFCVREAQFFIKATKYIGGIFRYYGFAIAKVT